MSGSYQNGRRFDRAEELRTTVLDKIDDAMTQDEIRDKLTPLYSRPDLVLVILFGSTATGATHRQSDVDIAILGSNVLDIVEMTNAVMRLLSDNRADVVDLRRTSPLLAMEVARHGRVLYERRLGDYAAFYSLAYRRYVDTAKLRRAQQEAIAVFLHARGLA